MATLPLLYIGCSKTNEVKEDPRFSDPRVVLQVGDSKLTLGDVNKRFATVKFESAKQEFDMKKGFVEQFLQRFLLIEGAKEAGITAELDTSVIRRSLLQNLYNEKILSKINVTDSDVADFFQKFGGEVQVGQIAVYDSLLADSIYNALTNGGDFEQLARQYSRDEMSASKGGALGYISYGRLPDKVQEKLAGSLFDLKGIKGRVEVAVENLLFFIAREEGFCRWFEVKKGGKGMLVRLCSSPLEVAESIKSVLLDKFKTIVVTSATLAVGERFDYLEKRTGINLLERSRVTELLLASPFDYKHQAFVGIPDDMPEPTAAGFEAALHECLLQGLGISQGRAFVLFTSYELLGRIHNRLAEPLKQLGLALAGILIALSVVLKSDRELVIDGTKDLVEFTSSRDWTRLQPLLQR